MEVIVGISGASTAAMLLTALFKLGFPSASSAAIAGVAFISGQISAALVTMAGDGIALQQKVVASMVITGILAAAAAAGVSRTDQSAETKRAETKEDM